MARPGIRWSRPGPRAGGALLLAAASLISRPVVGQSPDALGIVSVSLDPPTLHTLGVQMLISDDQNRNARVTVRYRPLGSTDWCQAPPLFRVFPETVTQTVPQQFAGSIFDLAPDSTYEIELHATDPDGPVNQTRSLTGRTRPVPRRQPVSATTIAVGSVAGLQSALASAQPGHVIVLADGVYAGAFFLGASGTAANPIVIRGQSASGAVLDGLNCPGCNVLEVSGSYVHVEDLTIRDAVRALRFLGTGTRNNVARRLHITNVVHGIAQGTNQRDFHICDNVIEGRLVWPWVFDPNASAHWDDRGVAVHGDGHVVCHNRMSGFGDPMINMKVLARAIDFYGNDVLDSFDGTELDLGGGNVRAFRNRWTNVAAAISMQPIYGGPAYVLRNVLLNVVDEQIKLKSLGGTDEPSGALIHHNTFVSPDLALNLQTPITGHNFAVMNNLFVGPQAPAGRTVEWTAGVDRGDFDFNGYFPDGGFWLGTIGGVFQVFPNFAALQGSGVFEGGGTLLTTPIFAGGFVGPADGTVHQDPADFTLAAASNALDRGTPLPGINHSFVAGAPDLGALESGCPTPTYGPRAAREEHLAAAIDCDTDVIFKDGFESGSFDAWSASATDAGDLGVSSSAALLLTTHGLRGMVDDTAGLYVQDNSPRDENRYRARFYVDPNDFDPGEAQAQFRTRIFIAFEESPTRRLSAIVLRRLGGVYSLRGRARLDDNNQADTPFFTITNASHAVEVDWKRSSGPDANDGAFHLWIDGNLVSSLTGLDNSLSAVDFARLGALSVKSGASGSLFWDEFDSRRRSYIGP